MEELTSARKYCVQQLIPAVRNPEVGVDLEAIGEHVQNSGSVVQEIFDENQGEDSIAALKAIVASLQAKEQELAQGMVDPTSDELGDLEAAANKLWILDTNRLVAGAELVLNFQEDTRYGDDNAHEALFEYVDGHAMSKSTFMAFYKLLDNYTAEAGVTEQVTDEEKQEIFAFLDVAVKTPVMQYVMKYLNASGKLPDDAQDEYGFKGFLYRLWFYFYSKEARFDSSGFEHVFAGDTRDGKVGGMHNWIQLLVQERKSELNYLGYITSRGVDGDEEPGSEYLMSISFDWKGESSLSDFVIRSTHSTSVLLNLRSSSLETSALRLQELQRLLVPPSSAPALNSRWHFTHCSFCAVGSGTL
uniref:EndoU domain-containing protein n=1 Tax=Rhodosorus marinus TaxID=101924 RepID=A0A7S2ZP02_9RHOD|mmetsp:Transcript_26985/g.104944  ORF Transcript_26985/g.104944 Transcript_26985/m.104944 type:complete len:359 (+) Transcript_26985:381-1457(+)